MAVVLRSKLLIYAACLCWPITAAPTLLRAQSGVVLQRPTEFQPRPAASLGPVFGTRFGPGAVQLLPPTVAASEAPAADVAAVRVAAPVDASARVQLLVPTVADALAEMPVAASDDFPSVPDGYSDAGVEQQESPREMPAVAAVWTIRPRQPAPVASLPSPRPNRLRGAILGVRPLPSPPSVPTPRIASLVSSIRVLPDEPAPADAPADADAVALDAQENWDSLPPPRADLDRRASGDAADRPDMRTSAEQQLDIEQVAERIQGERIFAERQYASLSLADLLTLSLTHSKIIHVLRIQPAEDLQAVNQEFGQFDWRAFVDSAFLQDSQPVGNLAQTNLALDQVRNEDHGVAFGVRKQTQFGGQLTLSERLGVRDTNSGLLNPEDPGNARMSITFAQELMRDGGRDVVLSRALVANLVAEQTRASSFAEVSNRLRDVLLQYWDLYQKRGDYFIQLSLIRWAEDTLGILESRSRIDAEANSIEQARALLFEARANLETAKAAVLISQDELYRLVNAPQIDSNRFELLTAEPPSSQRQDLGLAYELQEALVHRAEVAEKLLEIRAAAIVHHVSLNQLLPRLTFSIESSLNGLDRDNDFWGARANVTEVDPSYQANLNFEIFLGNRTARAQNKQAQLTIRRLQFEYEDQIEQVRLDVSRAIRTLNAANRILEQRLQTLQARREEIEYLRLRRDVIPQAGASPSLLLEQFFQAINRLVVSQQAFIAALTAQQAAAAELLQAKGVLLSASEIPQDFPVAVPSAARAFDEQWDTKASVRQEALDTVVVPGRAMPSTPTRR